MRELQTCMVAQAINFAITVVEACDKFVGDSEPPSYRLLFSRTQPKAEANTVSHLNQLTLSMEAICFFLHALSCYAFRSDSEKLREAIFDPSVLAIAHLFATMIVSQAAELDVATLEDEILTLMNEREGRYGAAASLLGENRDDRQSAFAVAGPMIAQSLGRPRQAFLIQVLRTALLRALVEMKLPDRTEELEALL